MAEFVRGAIEVKKSSIAGLGVFAKKALKKAQCIEECPIILTGKGSQGLEDYSFAVNSDSSLSAFLCGYGSIYNHSNEPNASCYIDADNRKAQIVANRYIFAGEEIFISYSDERNNASWFDSRQIPVLEISAWRQWWCPKKDFFIRAVIACSLVVLIKECCKLFS